MCHKEKEVETHVTVSVVICTYNRKDKLKLCLNSVLKQTFKDYEIIIIDDHSDEKFNDIVENFHIKEVKCIIHRNNKNMGISYSRNKGVDLASSDIIAFIDDDCIAREDWLYELIKPFQDPQVAIVGGLIKDIKPINIAMMAGMGHYKRFNKKGPCNSLPGGAANLAVRKEFYITRPICNLALEDWELCQNAVDSGYLIYNNPNAIVVHQHYHNFKTLFRQRYRYGIGLTWFRKSHKFFPLNLQTLIFVIALFSLPLVYIWNFLLITDILILLALLLFIFLKDFRKGEKTLLQAIVSFPVFILISLAEFQGRIIGLFKRPAQINFGTDHIKPKNL